MAIGPVQTVNVKLTQNGSTISTSVSNISSTQIVGTTFLSGPNGKSAYQIALDNGFVGNQTDWLQSLRGDPGEDGIGVPGPGVPTGGSAGQVLTKTSNTDYATAWITPTGQGSGTGLQLYSPDGTLWTMSIDNGGHTIWTSTSAVGTSNLFGTSFSNFRF